MPLVCRLRHVTVWARRTLAFSGTPCLTNALAMSLAGAPVASACGLLEAPCVDMEMTALAKSRRSSSETDCARRFSWKEPSCARGVTASVHGYTIVCRRVSGAARPVRAAPRGR